MSQNVYHTYTYTNCKDITVGGCDRMRSVLLTNTDAKLYSALRERRDQSTDLCATRSALHNKYTVSIYRLYSTCA